MVAVRYVLPVALVVLGIVLYAIDPKSAGLEGLTMSIGAALAVLVLNLLFRIGVQGDREREREAAAREHFAQHGRWPGE
jgi:chromate transport protein ChrA